MEGRDRLGLGGVATSVLRNAGKTRWRIRLVCKLEVQAQELVTQGEQKGALSLYAYHMIVTLGWLIR